MHQESGGLGSSLCGLMAVGLSLLISLKLFIFPSVIWVECLASLLGLATAAKSHQSCPTLCNPINSSPPGSPVPGILQARTLEWVAISFSNA